LYLNDAAADLFLLNREKALNKSASSIIGPPFDAQTLSQIRKELQKQGSWRRNEPSPLRPNDSLEWAISRIDDPQFDTPVMLAVAHVAAGEPSTAREARTIP
jgi:hypothetical protein